MPRLAGNTGDLMGRTGDLIGNAGWPPPVAGAGVTCQPPWSADQTYWPPPVIDSAVMPLGSRSGR